MIINYSDRIEYNDIVDLLSLFGYLTYQEIILLFKQVTMTSSSRKRLTGKIRTLNKQKRILLTHTGEVEYYHLPQERRTISDMRDKYEKSIKVLIWLLGMRDETSRYVNRVGYVSDAGFPCNLIFGCGDKIFEIYYLPSATVRSTVQLINRLDLDTMQKGYDLSYISRIAITDNKNDFDNVADINNLKIKATTDKNGFVEYEV